MELIHTLLRGHRYIDDVLFMGVPDVLSILYTTEEQRGIYPKELLLLEQTGEATLTPGVRDQVGVAYLDLSVVSDSAGIYTTLYDKREEVAALAGTLRCPHPLSRLSDACKLGVITSQFYRYHLICMRKPDLVEAASALLVRMIRLGYPAGPVFRKARAFGRIVEQRYGMHAAGRWERTCVDIIRHTKEQLAQ
jgi:hypothetical protein